MSITKSDLIFFANLSSTCGYDDERKEKYRKLGKKILKEIVKIIGLQKGEYEIRWNPGGIAVSGDHTLHTNWFYLALHDNCGFGTFYFRTCKGMKDYSGGPNQNVPWVKLTANGLPFLVDLICKGCPEPDSVSA